MSGPDNMLQRLFSADMPPPTDPAFRLAVLQRRAVRRFRERMFLTLGGGVLAMSCVAAIGPMMPAGSQFVLSRDLWPGICIAIAVLSTVFGVAQLRRPI